MDLKVDEYNRDIDRIAQKFRDIFERFMAIINENKHNVFSFKISLNKDKHNLNGPNSFPVHLLRLEKKRSILLEWDCFECRMKGEEKDNYDYEPIKEKLIPHTAKRIG